MESKEFEAELVRVKGLKSSKDLSEEAIVRLVKINLLVRDFKASQMFDNSDEQKLAEENFRSYLENHEIESQSELDTLKSLIYNEVFELRLQKFLNKISKEEKYPDSRLTSQLTEIQNQKLSLKIKLGIDQEKKIENELTGLQILVKRFDKYINTHRNEFTITCPHGELILVRKRVKDFDLMPHPWFAGRWFFNYEIIKDVKDGKLSKEDAWRYMCCASQGGDYKPAFSKQYCTDYIDYCLSHWDEIVDSLKIQSKE